MKNELGSFDGEQIRINTRLLSTEEYNQKLEHEKVHNYLTYLSTIGLLQQIAKEYKGGESSLFLYLFKRGNKIQELVALFCEYGVSKQKNVKDRLFQKLNGITTEAKNAIVYFLNDIDNEKFIEEYLDLFIYIGILSLSADFEKMTIKKFFYSNPNKFLETFFRENGISPKRKFEEIVIFCHEELKGGVSFQELTKILKKYNSENINFIIQNISDVVRREGDDLFIDVRKDSFDLLLNIVVSSNIKKREEIIDVGIYQIPIFSKLDLKYKEVTPKKGKKYLQETLKNGYMNFMLLKQYSMFKDMKDIDLIIPEYNSNSNGIRAVLFKSTLELALAQETINIVTRLPRSLNFSAFLIYFIEYVLKKVKRIESKKFNFFILGSELHMKEVIQELIETYGEKSLKYFYKDFEQDTSLISVYEAPNANIIIYSEYSLEVLQGFKNPSADTPDRKYNELISVYLNLLFRTDIFDRI